MTHPAPSGPLPDMLDADGDPLRGDAVLLAKARETIATLDNAITLLASQRDAARAVLAEDMLNAGRAMGRNDVLSALKAWRASNIRDDADNASDRLSPRDAHLLLQWIEQTNASYLAEGSKDAALERP